MESAQEQACLTPDLLHPPGLTPHITTIACYCKRVPELVRKAPNTSGQLNPGVGPGVKESRFKAILYMSCSMENPVYIIQDRHEGR